MFNANDVELVWGNWDDKFEQYLNDMLDLLDELEKTEVEYEVYPGYRPAEGWTKSEFLDFDNDTTLHFALVYEGRTIGYARVAYSKNTNSLSLKFLIITKEYRNKDLGRTMFGNLIELSEEKFPNAKFWTVWILSNNFVAKNLYKSKGFVTNHEVLVKEIK